MSMAVFWLISVNSPDNHAKDGCLSALKREVCQNILVPAPRAGTQKNRPYQSDIYTVSFHAIPRQAREQGSFDTPSFFSEGTLNRNLITLWWLL